MLSRTLARAAGGRTGIPWRRFVVAVASTLTLLGATVGPAAAVDFPPLEPVAQITATPTAGTAPLTVAFDGSGSVGPNPLVSWAWTFGDGSTGSGITTTHVYTTPGTYDATLVVADAFGLFSFPAHVSIAVSAPMPPPAPTNLAATSLSKSAIGLTWTNATTDQTSVTIERCTGSGCTAFATVAALPGTATAFTDTRLRSKTTYTYRVRAVNAVGPSGYSNIAFARTLR